jgi:uncharacterized membrane protein
MLRQHLHHRHTGLGSGFHPRGLEVTRMEGFSDAVFAFTLTLITVSLEVPHSIQELLNTMRGFPGFAVCFFLLLQVWFKHCEFFRRYGLQDGMVKLWNSVLLFVVLFYVFPLKFLWSNMFAGHVTLSVPDGRALFIIYGVGAGAIFLIFALLYQHAWGLRGELELNEIERFDTRASIHENLLMAAIPLLSAGFAAVAPANILGLGAPIYFLYLPLLTIQGMRQGRARKKLEKLLPAQG